MMPHLALSVPALLFAMRQVQLSKRLDQYLTNQPTEEKTP